MAANLSNVSPSFMLMPASDGSAAMSGRNDNIDSAPSKLSLSPAVANDAENVVGIHASVLFFSTTAITTVHLL